VLLVAGAAKSEVRFCSSRGNVYTARGVAGPGRRHTCTRVIPHQFDIRKVPLQAVAGSRSRYNFVPQGLAVIARLEQLINIFTTW